MRVRPPSPPASVLPHTPSRTSPRKASRRGFALVATLSLMILLAILCVGLLGLSSVTLRTSSHGSAQAEARANARMALMLAIGELQRYAGPDRAVTATSEILATPSAPVAKPNTTGVWESWWDFNPNASPDYAAEKTGRFRRWLVSSADTDAPLSRDFAATAWTGKTIELVGSGSLGPAATDEDKVTAGLVPVSRGGVTKGSYAWHVSDESVKARINLYRDPARNTTLADKRSLLGGHRPDASLIEAADGTPLDFLPSDLTPGDFADASALSGKLINLNQTELLDGAKGKIKPLRNDITPYSLGVMSDVRGGGLKQDLSSAFEMGSASANTLPAEFTGKRLYASTHGITDASLTSSDPNWSALAGYYNSYRNLSNPETNPTYALKQGATSISPVPDVYNPAPVIAKVDTIFSIVARPLVNQAFWISNINSPLVHYYDYAVGLIISPVVTLHNPYNVNVSFQKMEVSFKNLPVAFNLMFQNNGSGVFASQSAIQGSFEAMNTYGYNSNDPFGQPVRNNRNFVITIADWADDDPLPGSTAVNGPIVMKPGQTLVCGIALRPNSSYDQDTKSGVNVTAMDWQNTLFNKIKARPKYTPGIGFETCAVGPGHLRGPSPPNTTKITLSDPNPTFANANLYPGCWSGQIFTLLRDAAASPKIATRQPGITDRFYVQYKVQRPEWFASPDNTPMANTDMKSPPASFAVTAKLQATASDSLVDYANLQFDYGDQDTLTYKALSKPTGYTTANSNLNNIFNNRVYRYPPSGSLKGSDFSAPAGVPYSQQATYVHPFAIFSAYSRTTNGGVYETGKRKKSGLDSPLVNFLKDGRLAGKPFLFHNASRSNFVTNLATEKPAVQAYELNFQPFLSQGDFQDYMDVDANNRVPSIAGNKSTSGIKSGSYIEIPSGPMQTIADFRRSNALTTAYAPYFVQPVGNSLLHPLMSADKVVESDPSIVANTMLDHSVLANHAFYDRFYFSTFATRGSITPDTVFDQFMNGSAPLASQAFLPYLPAGKTVATAKAELYSAGVPVDKAYTTAAEYQMLRGPFNVNSTSVQAWKAVLASMNKSDVATLWARNTTLETNTADGAAITPMSMVNGGSLASAAVDSSKIDNVKTNTWNGYRELDDSQLETLAIKIVEQVRLRGPFLSMSEFVNRQVGASGELTLSGALEAAIAEAEINEKKDATSADSFLNQVPVTASDISDTKLYNYKTPEATLGNPAAGAPGWVSQGDLMRILEPSATVRGDTFVIRAYGEALDSKGNVAAKAYAEAVVQRVPEYLDQTDRPSINAMTDPTAKPVNKLFGRCIKVVSFRWLSPDEI